MKRLLHISLILSGILYCMPMQAQFLKKLNKKVQDAAENKVLDKSANKTSQSVDKGMDDIFTLGKDKPKKNNKTNKKVQSNSKSSVSPRGSYLFSYLYTLHFTSGEVDGPNGKVNADVDFLLTPKADYMGIRSGDISGQGNAVLVIDQQKSTTFTFISSGSQNMMMTHEMDLENIADDTEDGGNFKITNLPNKTFLGYSCKGMLLEDDEWEIKLYYTDQAGLSMASVFEGSSEIPLMGNSMQKGYTNLKDGLVMYMEGTNKKNKKENYIMEAKKLEKVDYTFKTDGYQSISGSNLFDY